MWTDPNGDRVFQASELGACPGFSGGLNTRYADGVKWPYSDELTAGIETEAARRASAWARCSTTAPTATRSASATSLQPTSAYTAITVPVPNGPGGTVASPKATTATVYNVASAVNALVDNVRDNDPYLDTDYKGIEFTATKRFSRKWQMQAGFTIGKNKGGVTNGTDLNDPNVTQPEGIIGNDSDDRASGCRAATCCRGTSRWPARSSPTTAIPTSRPTTLTRAAAATLGTR